MLYCSGTDNFFTIGSCGWTQMLLLTEYQENGSLLDFLSTNVIDVESCVSD